MQHFAMSVTLTTEQIQLLKQIFIYGNNGVVITQGVHRDNLVLQLKKYRRQRQSVAETCTDDADCDGLGSSHHQ